MAKLESNFKNMVLVLTSVALIAGFLLASVYSITEVPIQESKLAKQQNAIKEVLPEFDNFETETVNGLNVYKAYKSNSFVGAAVESFSPNGFSGEIRLMVGFDKNGNIINYVVLEQKETPGLGTKVVDWFKTDKANQSIIDKNPATNNIKLKKDGGEIDAITASTISSRAFIQAVTSAYNAYADNPDAPDANSSATSATDANTSATGAVDTNTSATKETADTDANSGATY